jgi:hypothetical protein
LLIDQALLTCIFVAFNTDYVIMAQHSEIDRDGQIFAVNVAPVLRQE